MLLFLVVGLVVCVNLPPLVVTAGLREVTRSSNQAVIFNDFQGVLGSFKVYHPIMMSDDFRRTMGPNNKLDIAG